MRAQALAGTRTPLSTSTLPREEARQAHNADGGGEAWHEVGELGMAPVRAPSMALRVASRLRCMTSNLVQTREMVQHRSNLLSNLAMAEAIVSRAMEPGARWPRAADEARQPNARRGARRAHCGGEGDASASLRLARRRHRLKKPHLLHDPAIAAFDVVFSESLCIMIIDLFEGAGVAEQYPGNVGTSTGWEVKPDAKLDTEIDISFSANPPGRCRYGTDAGVESDAQVHRIQSRPTTASAVARRGWRLKRYRPGRGDGTLPEQHTCIQTWVKGATSRAEASPR